MNENFDFSGWATRNDIRCADGRTIRRDAFKHCDGEIVPLVWNHDHNDAFNVLGHAMLENRDDGVYAYCSLNDTDAGRNAKKIIKHGDVTALSIYANGLKEVGHDVLHGVIREVSLVLAGANPGAYIENVMAHSEEDGVSAIIYNNDNTIELAHSDESEEKVEESSNELSHAEESSTEDKKEDTKDESENKTVEDVIKTMNEEQKKAMYIMVAAALEDSKKEESDDNEEGGEDMKHNVFDQQDEQQGGVLAHDAMKTIIEDGKRYGSLKESFLAHADEYGIKDIEYLFPDAKTLQNTPDFISRKPSDWVDVTINGVSHSPFSRIKSIFADITEDEARAKGYMKGNRKKDEVFSLLKRTTTPTTIYKKQKLDRDDIVDITDFDVVAWIKTEMRMMLNEEIARAVLFGDGRLSSSDDKIPETNIRPIYNDDALYTIKKIVTPEADETISHAIISASVSAQDDYQGSGSLTAFMPQSVITPMLLMETLNGTRLYPTLNELAAALNVDRIVKLPKGICPDDVYGVIVDLKDYNVGADKGGEVNMFDDFDIDYNQQKYLMETRCSGALVRPYSAIVLKAAGEEG
jgi:HK97 family phage prohead protease